jgi:hypothetical protein
MKSKRGASAEISQSWYPMCTRRCFSEREDAVREEDMAKYGPKAQRKVARAMRERKRGTLRSGRSGRRVTSRRQAIAIGLSEARRSGAKVPPRPRRASS